MKETGGTAFPSPYTTPGNQGMTLRDYFAAEAMQGWMIGVDFPNIELCAKTAYEMADAMLEARK